MTNKAPCFLEVTTPVPESQAGLVHYPAYFTGMDDSPDGKEFMEELFRNVLTKSKQGTLDAKTGEAGIMGTNSWQLQPPCFVQRPHWVHATEYKGQQLVMVEEKRGSHLSAQ